ncbi:MAG: hypothetical protein C0504_17260 [Candidatus Solibacter sp.]|nr:hypothetical protein [Candidatus Solibacter sp.]
MADVNLLPYAIAWAVLALVVILLAFWRKNISAHEDDTLHLGGGAEVHVKQQEEIAKKLAKLDLWGKALTVVLVLAGLALGVVYGLQIWEATSKQTF